MSEMSLAKFIGHVAAFPIRLHEHGTRAMEAVAKIVQAEAKREIGTYQDSAGPFVAWAELADSTKNDRVNKGYTPNDPGLRSGEMRDSIERVSNHEEAVIGSDNDKLVWFELGTNKQPPRSVLGIAVVHKEKAIEHHIGAGVVAALVGHDVFNGRMPIIGQ